jgi:hypothetical protein
MPLTYETQVAVVEAGSVRDGAGRRTERSEPRNAELGELLAEPALHADPEALRGLLNALASGETYAMPGFVGGWFEYSLAEAPTPSPAAPVSGG